MADSGTRGPNESKSSAFIRGAGTVNDPNNKLWGPARWVVQMIQYLVAIIIITIGEGLKSIIKGEKPQGRRRNARND